MSFATRCPSCQTLFKVSLGQLQMYEGQVRCGQCGNVFSGVEHLTAADTEAWKSLALEPEARNSANPAENTMPTPQFLEAATAGKKASSFTIPRISETPRALRYLIGLLTAALLVQLLWWQRLSWIPASADEWLVNSPFATLFANNPSQSLVIEGSGLVDQGSDTLQLEITLNNQSSRASQWPHLTVNLLDSQGTLLASRLLKPSDYFLRPNPSETAGKDDQNGKPAVIQAGALIEIISLLDISALKKRLPGAIAAGFEIQIHDRSVDLI